MVLQSGTNDCVCYQRASGWFAYCPEYHVSFSENNQRRSRKTQLKGFGGLEGENRSKSIIGRDKRSHIPNGSIYKCRVLRIQGIVTIYFLDFERPDEVHEEAINSGFSEVLSRTFPRPGSASSHAQSGWGAELTDVQTQR